MKQDSFCPIPWTLQAFRNDGYIRLCAQSHTSANKGLCKNSNGEIYNGANADLFEARNSQLMKDIRKAIMRGEWHESCVRCQRETQAGVQARSAIERNLNEDIINFEKIKQLTNADGSIANENFPTYNYDIRLGNKCNLKCRTCNPSESDAWYNDHQQLWGVTYYRDITGDKLHFENNGTQVTLKNSTFNWYESSHFLKQLEKNSSHVRKVHFSGGEPLLIKAHYDILEMFIEKGLNKNLTLEYITNGTIVPQKALDLWSQFKKINIGVSIDGIGLRNDYIRYPAKWSQIENNIRKLDRQLGSYAMWFAPTIFSYNILYLPELMLWSMENYFEKFHANGHRILFTEHPLHNPSFLNTQVFPLEIKEKIKNRLLASLPELREGANSHASILKFNVDHLIRQVEDKISSHINFMYANDQSKDFPKFLYYTQKIDRIRNQSYRDYLPELAEIIENSSQYRQIEISSL